MSKFYRSSTTQKIFGTVSKLCEIGELDDLIILIVIGLPSMKYKIILKIEYITCATEVPKILMCSAQS